MLKMTVGCDPEVLLTDGNTVVTACGKIGGTKNKGNPISDTVSVLEDNVMLEFNIKPVQYVPEELSLQLATSSAVEEVKKYVKSLKKSYGIKIADFYEFNAVDLECDDAKIFGCVTDLDAHNMGHRNVALTAEAVGNKRFAGGHIHVGYDVDACEVPKWALVQLSDWAVSMMENPIVEIGEQRAKYYGRPGAYRDKSYGFEYRTPGNRWLNYTGAGRHYDAAEAVLEVVHWAINNQTKARTLWEIINWGFVRESLRGRNAQRHLNLELFSKYITPINVKKKSTPILNRDPVFTTGAALPAAPPIIQPWQELAAALAEEANERVIDLRRTIDPAAGEVFSPLIWRNFSWTYHPVSGSLTGVPVDATVWMDFRDGEAQAVRVMPRHAQEAANLRLENALNQINGEVGVAQEVMNVAAQAGIAA